MNDLWYALTSLDTLKLLFFLLALAVAFGFEFINGFHDTANAVTTVIYTNSLKPTPAVFFSGFMNFLGVLLGGTAVAFSIVNLLPVDVLIDGKSGQALAMVMALLIGGVIWNLGTWWLGLPVSSSHTLIGSILGVGLINSLVKYGNASGVNWAKARDVGLALLLSPMIGFLASYILLRLLKFFAPNPALYVPPEPGGKPPGWIRGILLATCGGVSFAHGSNDGQKGMGLILLVLIGFLPSFYALDLNHPGKARDVYASAQQIRELLDKDPGQLTDEQKANLDTIIEKLRGKQNFAEIPADDRWQIRQNIYLFEKNLASSNDFTPQTLEAVKKLRKEFKHSTEYIPFWVVLGVALALGIGTTVGYERIVVTVAEKIGKSHLTYAQGAAAEVVAAATISLADIYHMPVSTTQVLSSGVAGTMVANKSGVQSTTVEKILLAWLMTFPASMAISAALFMIFRMFV